MNFEIMNGDCLEKLKELPSESVNCCVTSPPYYGLRDYGTARWQGGDSNCDHNPQKPDGGDRSDRTLPLGRGGVYRDVCGKCGAVRIDQQIGLEQTPDEYVENLVNVFREVKRVLRDDGTVWLNLGDSYARDPAKVGVGHKKKGKQATNSGSLNKYQSPIPSGLKPKDLIGIPWRVAFALQADGWWLRQDIIWHKPNPMPESVQDRCTKSHEYIFLLTKSSKYYYDHETIMEKASYAGVDRGGSTNRYEQNNFGGDCKQYDTRNKRSVWTVTTKPFKGAHFATFPPKLIEPCILAGCPKSGVVLDPFMGSGTTGVVSLENDRQFIGIELNPEYIKIAEKRIKEATAQQGLF